MPFGNPIVGGGGVLIRTAIQSPNFVHGSAGWSINKDGSSEFTAVQINGGTLIMQGSTGAIFVYSPSPGTGNLRMSISPSAGTDTYGNSYPAGICTFGTDGTKVASWLQSVTSASVWQSFQPQNAALAPGSISAFSSGNVGTLQLAAPKPIGIFDQGLINLVGGSATGPGIQFNTGTYALMHGGDFRTDTGAIVDGSLPAEVIATTGLTNGVTSVTPTYASLSNGACVATMANPSLTRGLLVEVKYSGWIVANGSGVRGCCVATGSNTIGSGVGVGGAASWGEVLYMGSFGSAASMQHFASYTCTIPAGGTTSFELQACRDSATGTESFNYPVVRVTPIRYV